VTARLPAGGGGNSLRAGTRWLAALSLAVLVAGSTSCCARRRPPPALPVDPATGRAGFQFLYDPAALSFRFSDGEVLDRPQPAGDLEPPAYPARPLDAGFGPATVAVRIVIDEEGKVSQVLDSPLLASSPGPFAGDFRQAVDDALRGWRFTPGAIKQTREGEESSRPVRVYYDVRFDFEIVEGQGRATIVGSPR